MQTVAQNRGGTLIWQAPARPDDSDATDTVEIRNAESQKVAPTQWAFDSDVDTTVTSATGTSIALADGTNVVRGREYLLGPNAAGQSEWVRCRGIQGVNFTAQYPVRYVYVSGDAFRSTHIAVPVPAAVVTTPSRAWHGVVEWQVGDVRQPPGVVQFDVVRFYINHQPATLNDVQARDPLVRERVPTSPAYDWDLVFEMALQDVLRDVNAALYVGGLLTEDDWKTLVVLKVLYAYVGLVLGAEIGPDYTDKYKAEYDQRLALLKSQAIVDTDQDGAFEEHERRAMGGRKVRG